MKYDGAMRSAEAHPAEVYEALRHRGSATRIAVVGATNNPRKYGNVIVRNLLGKGYTVLPVNLRDREIAGIPAYRFLRDVPPPIHVVSVVVPPTSTLEVLKEAAELRLPAVFLQDGSFDQAVLDFAAKAPFKTMYDACIMVVTARP